MLTTKIHPLPSQTPDARRPRNPRTTRGTRASVRGTRPTARTSYGRPAYEEQNRLGLLVVHGAIGMFAGVLVVFDGTATELDEHTVWPHVAVGLMAAIGGLLLLLGLARRPRVVWMQVAGLAALGAWALAMVGGYAVTAVLAHDVITAWPWDHAPRVHTAHLYPIAVYLGLFAMTAVHLATVLRAHEADSRRRRVTGVAVQSVTTTQYGHDGTVPRG